MFDRYMNPYPYGNSYPTGTQPYGYAMPNYAMPQQQMNTNKIYVSGIEEVRQRQLPNNSEVLFIDNDKPVLYQKTVDNRGQFEIKTFTITACSPQESDKDTGSIDLSGYAKTSDLESIRSEINIIKERLENGRAENL